MKPSLARIYTIVIFLIIVIGIIKSPIIRANAQDLPHKPTSTAIGEHVLLIITLTLIDVTDTLFVQDEQVYAVVDGVKVPVVLDYTNHKVWSTNGTQIGFITVD